LVSRNRRIRAATSPDPLLANLLPPHPLAHLYPTTHPHPSLVIAIKLRVDGISNLPHCPTRLFKTSDRAKRRKREGRTSRNTHHDAWSALVSDVCNGRRIRLPTMSRKGRARTSPANAVSSACKLSDGGRICRQQAGEEEKGLKREARRWMDEEGRGRARKEMVVGVIVDVDHG